MNWRDILSEFAERKTQEADLAEINRLETTSADDGHWTNARRIGNAWTRDHYDGDFVLAPAPGDRPAISLVFVQSRDGNTGAHNPDDLGGGPTDKHLIYEGLSRVAADAVLSGASTAAGKQMLFSIWRRELVALRAQLGLPRHPTQVIVSKRGRLDIEGALLFNAPEIPVIVMAGDECRAVCAAAIAARPWISLVPFEDEDWNAALGRLRREHGLHRISAIGGRHTATSLLDAGVIQDLCLTTAQVDGGEPNTPYYIGARIPELTPIVTKRERATTNPIVFQHFAMLAHGRRAGAGSFRDPADRSAL